MLRMKYSVALGFAHIGVLCSYCSAVGSADGVAVKSSCWISRIEPSLLVNITVSAPLKIDAE